MARRRQVREAPLGPPVTIEIKSGWCNDGHHEGCNKSFTYYEKTYVCPCNCHAEKKGKKK
jgi:hypothetical protein